MKGTRMAWVAIDGRRVDGISLGPDDNGLLHVRDDRGQVHEVMSGDIQLAGQQRHQ
jgi:BirA family biotin operon repressor/biotin-[acetyl-CoA-carboxylase] ligase